MKRFLFAIITPFLFSQAFAQDDDLEKMLNDLNPEAPKKVFATFKTTKVISAQSIETVKKGTLDFRITHRFGNIGAHSNGGGHTLYGFDEASDIRIAFDYGVTNKITLGFARNKRFENLDFTFKYRFLEQTDKMPVSVCLYTNAAFTPMRESQLYLGVDTSFKKDFSHRLAYTSQLLIARKFSSWLSLELIGGYTHRNFVKEAINPTNNAQDENGLVHFGIAGRLKLTKRVSLVADYFYVVSDYRTNNTALEFFNPLSVGIEIETGGHVFHLNFSNAPGILESDFIAYTTDSWLDGGFKFGFNISRVFTIVKPKDIPTN